MKPTIAFILCFEFVVFSTISLAYKVEPGMEMHQQITNQSGIIYPLAPHEITEYLGTLLEYYNDDASYKVGYDNIISGSAEEDYGTNAIRHFWQPDSPNEGEFDNGILAFKSSYRKAKEYWEEKVIPKYIRGDIDESYYWLGRVAHLLEDASVSAHVHLDPHMDQLDLLLRSEQTKEYLDDSIQEEYTGKYFDEFTANSLGVIGMPYYYDHLISQWDNDDWEDINPNLKKADYPAGLFKLFWYTAQKTQYYASDDENGNHIYVDVYENQHDFTSEGIDLWYGDDVVIINNKSAFFDGDIDNTNNEDFYYYHGITSDDCIHMSLEYCQQIFADPSMTKCYYCDTNYGPNIEEQAEALLKHAMKAVAGLYMLFWDSVHIDWPVSDHDFQRTAFTSLKGDIGAKDSVADSEQFGWTMTEDYGLYDNPIIADVDKDAKMEIIVTTETSDDRGRAYVLDYKSKKFRLLWPKPFQRADAFKQPASVVDIDNDQFRVIVFGEFEGGCVFVLNAENGHKKWSYCIDESGGMMGELGHTAVADLDLDGKKEVIFTDYKHNNPAWQGKLYIIKGDSKQDARKSDMELLGTPLNIGSAILATSGGSGAAVSIADADNDDYLDSNIILLNITAEQGYSYYSKEAIINYVGL